MSKMTLAILTAVISTFAVGPVYGGDRGDGPQLPDPLQQAFLDPPSSARPRVWWHWMDGNITQDGIAKDLAWMKRVGIGGAQNFDVALRTPQIVERRLPYMSAGWKDAFRFAAFEADRLGLELSIAASPGWSETGGPWVAPENALKKLVWSETDIVGGRRLRGILPKPPVVSGPFQSLPKQPNFIDLMGGIRLAVPEHYSDIAVLAFPAPEGATTNPASVHDDGGNALDHGALTDADLVSAVDLGLRDSAEPRSIVLNYATPVTIRSAQLFVPGGFTMFIGSPYRPHLEASVDGKNWQFVAALPLSEVPTTASFPAVVAKSFRVRFIPTAGFSASSPTPSGVELDSLYSGSDASNTSLKVSDLKLFTEPRIDRFETKAGFSFVPDYYALVKPDDQIAGIDPKTVINLTSKLRSDGTLDWTPPPGHWRIVRLGYSLLGSTNHPAPLEATGLEVDKYDGAAVRNYLEHYIGMYKSAAGADFLGSRGVQAIVNDSIEVGAANWTPRMLQHFRELRGYDPTPWLPALTGTIIQSREASDKFLYDYRQTLADLIAREHYGTIAEVAHEHGLKVYGEALENFRPLLGDDMAMRRYADVPTAAMWWFSREDGPSPTHVADVKGASSVSHVYGQNLVAAESMTSELAPWANGPADLKRIIDLEFVLGMNRPLIHTSVHAPVDDKLPGLSLYVFGQQFNRLESWAELARPWMDYIARNAFLLQQGRNHADVAYFYGEEAPLTGLFGEKPVTDAPRRFAYDFVNRDALFEALAVRDGDLVSSGGARFRALYLGGSSHMMTVATLRRLRDLVAAGATIIGKPPVASPSLVDSRQEFDSILKELWRGEEINKVGKGQVIVSADVETSLISIGVKPDFEFTGGDQATELPFVHRKMPSGDSYFIVNRTNRPETVEAKFSVIGRIPELWNAVDGTVEPLSYRMEDGFTIVPLHFAAEESKHIVFRRTTDATSLTLPTRAQVDMGGLTGPWSVAFEMGRGAPATMRFASLQPWNEHPSTDVRYFSGVASYSQSFTLPISWRPGRSLWLDLGEVREIAEVSLNGRLVGTAWHAPWRVDLSKAAVPGRNQIEIRVANLWVNRLIGDRQPGEQKLTWTAIPTYKPNASLRRSGLIGPVRLITDQTTN